MRNHGFRIEVVKEEGSDGGEIHLALSFSTDAERQLFTWWLQTAAQDAALTIPKSVEYGGGSGRPGSADLRIIGENLQELLGWEGHDDALAQELGAFFYCQGKIARLISDYQQRRPGKPDTWFDINVYSMMARRLQEVGVWP